MVLRGTTAAGSDWDRLKWAKGIQYMLKKMYKVIQALRGI